MIVRHALALATFAAAAAASTHPAGAAARAPVYVQVVEKEYTLQLSRLRVPAGTTILQAINFGMDNHDLILQRNASGAKPIVFKQLAPNSRATKTLALQAGRYTLWCSVSDHRKRGMVATLRVG